MIRLVFVLAIWTSFAHADVFVVRRSTGSKITALPNTVADFGQALPDDGLPGFVVAADPPTACNKSIAPAPKRPSGAEDLGMIALIARYGGCDFVEKVKAATAANFSGAIIYNVDSDHLVPMGGGGADELIPSVFIGSHDAELLLTKFSYPHRSSFYVVLTADEPFDINSYLLPFAIVIGICFIVMLSIVIYKCVQDARRARRHRLPKSALKKLPVIKFKEGEPYETCCICLDDFAEGEKLRILPCDHGYHTKCIDPWLVKNKRICPQCRQKVFPELGRENGQDSSDDENNGGEVQRRGGQEVEVVDERAPLLAPPSSNRAGAISSRRRRAISNYLTSVARERARTGNDGGPAETEAEREVEVNENPRQSLLGGMRTRGERTRDGGGGQRSRNQRRRDNRLARRAADGVTDGGTFTSSNSAEIEVHREPDQQTASRISTSQRQVTTAAAVEATDGDDVDVVFRQTSSGGGATTNHQDVPDVNTGGGTASSMASTLQSALTAIMEAAVGTGGGAGGGAATAEQPTTTQEDGPSQRIAGERDPRT